MDPTSCERGSNTAATGEQSPLLKPENRTDDELGRRFAREHGEVVRYVAPWHKWLVWDGTRWAPDVTLAVETLAKRTNDDMWADVLADLRSVDQTQQQSLLAWAKYASSAHGTANMLKKARSEPGICITPDCLDRDPWVLNVLNGTIDLKTGRFRDHDKSDMLTKAAPVEYAAGADAPRWVRFVSEIMDGDAELIDFLQRLSGYWLTGSVRDHILPIFYGVGANGKSVFLTVMQKLLGSDYAMKAAPEFLTERKHPPHPTEVADLFGKRLVAAVEIESNHRLAEARVKELTGGDKLRVRRMREDFWEFDPTHKIVLAVNHKPEIHRMDNGIWRRVRLVPFNVIFDEARQDKQLTEKLQDELPGILNWALRGCLDWQARGGLGEPTAVTSATQTLRTESDSVGGFIDDCCILRESMSAKAGSLHLAYEEWCLANGHTPHNGTVFGGELTRLGFGIKRTNGGKVRLGIGLRAGEHQESA